MSTEEKLEIVYPSDWSYTLIGVDLSDIKASADRILEGREFSFRPSKASSGKKYFSAIVSCLVDNEEDRLSIYSKFKAEKEIRMVL